MTWRERVSSLLRWCRLYRLQGWWDAGSNLGTPPTPTRWWTGNDESRWNEKASTKWAISPGPPGGVGVPGDYVQVGTWLLPESYGQDYDHFTGTRMATEPGVCVALYAIASEVPAPQPAHALPLGPMEVGSWRFCPVCGRPARESEYVNDDPVCTCCDRPWPACPCTPPPGQCQAVE